MKTIAWITAKFDQVGGGERLIQEGLTYYRSKGHRPIVITWSYDDAVTFDRSYEPAEVSIVDQNGVGKSATRAIAKLKNIPQLRRLLKEHGVDLVFVQSEYDVILAWLATILTKTHYRFLIFGQIFQFPDDYAKYTFVFRRHLKRIVSSCAGYQETIPLCPPKIRFVDRVAMEIISVARFFAVRAADKLFAFSKQISWETQLLFGRQPTIAHGAYREEIIGQSIEAGPTLQKFGLVEKSYILSACRLVSKKRVGLIIDAYVRCAADVDLVIAGAGPEYDELKKQADRSNKADRVHFLGRVEEDDLMPLKRAAKLFVSMDIGDYDISPLEALVVGTPILLPREFDAEPTLANSWGVYICDARSDEVAAHIDAALCHSEGKPSFEALNDYSWESYFEMLVK
jgi:glycosyltransferase involved in cell wall biosynthesis